MKKFLSYIKKIHFIHYIVYVGIYTIVCINTTNITLIYYVGMSLLAFVIMNTWLIEYKQKKNENISLNK